LIKIGIELGEKSIELKEEHYFSGERNKNNNT
jgi:hypothetical protein